MMKTRDISLLLLLLVLLISVCSVSAQIPDLSGMSREELEALQQEILDRLPTETPTSVPTPTPYPTAVPTEIPTAVPTEIPTATPTAMPGSRTFNIYENKKLIVEALPGYMFINKPPEEGGDDGGNNPFTGSEEECDNYCVKVCPWADLVCYWNCYFPCVGEPYPDWHLEALKDLK